MPWLKVYNGNMNMFFDKTILYLYMVALGYLEAVSSLPLGLSCGDWCLKASCGIHWVMPPGIIMQ